MSRYDFTPEKGLAITSNVGFKTVWVIDSIPESELQTGKELFDDLLYYKTIEDSGFKAEYRKVVNSKEFFQTLDEILGVLRSTGNIPLIHLEVHGNPEGIALSSGEFVLFGKFFPALSRINEVTQNSVFVYMAACYGLYAVRLMIDADRAPFWGVFGPTQKLTAEEVRKCTLAFYGSLLNRESLNNALNEAKKAIPESASKLGILRSEDMFLRSFRSYLDDQCEGPGLEQRIQRFCEKLQAEKNFDLVQTVRHAEAHRNHLKSEEGRRSDFHRMSSVFFMHDLYPSNPNLPRPTFEMMLQFESSARQGNN